MANASCPHNRWHWQQDAGQSHQLAYRLDLAGGDQLELRGQLHSRQLKRENQLHYQAYQLNPVEVLYNGQRQKAIEEHYQHLIFMAGHGAQGQLMLTALPRYLELDSLHQGSFAQDSFFSDYAKPLKSLLELMQVQWPAGLEATVANASQWQGAERDHLGEYLAEYQAAAMDCALEKHKGGYQPLPEAEATSAEITPRAQLQQFAMRFDMNPLGLNSLDASQTFHIEIPAEASAQEQMAIKGQTLTLAALNTPIDYSLRLWSLNGELSGQDLLRQVVLSTKDLPADLQEALKLAEARHAFKGQNTERLAGDVIAATLARTSHGDTVESIYTLSRYLELHPEKAYELLPLLDGIDDADISARLIHALGDAGTPEAQEVLVNVVEIALEGDQKLQAIVALGAVASPEPSTLEALWSIADGSVPDMREDISNDDTALLALGSLAAKAALTTGTLTGTSVNAAEAQGTEQGAAVVDATAIVDHLIARLNDNKAVDPDGVLVLIESLNNAKTTSIAARDATLTYRASSDARVRKSAADLLARYNDQVSIAALEDLLVDQNSGVRSAAATSLASQGKTFQRQAVVETLSQQLFKDPSPSTRITLVKALAGLQQDFSGVRARLRHHQSLESSQQINTLIDQALSGAYD